MNTVSASPVEPVAGAYLSAESERWRLLHVTLGYR
jgi:hypothetical protein